MGNHDSYSDNSSSRSNRLNGAERLTSLNGLNEEDPITRLLHSRSGYAIRQAVKFSDRLHADPSYLAHSRRLECRP